MPRYRVMQETETGEEFNAFEGSMEECHDWIQTNAGQYEESRFTTEKIETYGGFDTLLDYEESNHDY